MTVEEIGTWFVNFLQERAKKHKKLRDIKTSLSGNVEFTYNETEYQIDIFASDEIVYGPIRHGDFPLKESVWQEYEIRSEGDFQEDFEDYFDEFVLKDYFNFASKLWKSLNSFKEEAESNEVESFFYGLIDSFVRINVD